MFLDRIVSKIKTAAANYRLYRRYIAGQKKSETDEKSVIYFDIRNPALERYFFTLVKFFEIAGCRIKLKKNFGLLLNLRNYSDLIYNIEDLEIVGSPPEKYDLWITDHEKGNAPERKAMLDTHYLKDRKEPGSAVFSYSMHPLIYERKIHQTIGPLRQNRRNIRLFSYSANLERYETDEIVHLFKKLSRKQVLLCARNFPETEKVTLIDTKDGLKKLYSEKTGLTIVENVRIELDDWLKTLAHADFFLAAPGVIMPFSHNLIEAMAVGTIPVTQYAELFTPPLTDQVNCVTFTDEADLTAKIKMILEMDEERIAALRAGAVRYYDEFFRPESVVANLLKKTGEVEKIYLLAGHLTVKALREDLTKNL
jgi:glycosyltransferase involved in cell wall biosynthesis